VTTNHVTSQEEQEVQKNKE